ncbi:GNAT family N-acetyltransferase [Lewinella sp. W8]|uniref:GNAT family N-acetyltransferase n=1 Tax=Lewinella sp. W8 TaxID=2528208 RepID=UPI00156632C4|nr:GNAT family N-acetyltransferase [Lewinella sp. W8]
MQFRPGRERDFTHLETFVWQAIFPAFDRPGLRADQRAENDGLVERARTEVITAFDHPHQTVFVAIDPKTRTLAGYLIADGSPRAYAEIKRLIVKRSFWGKDVGSGLLDMATDFIGRDRAISLLVRHYNERAIAFFAKHDFVHTGESAGSDPIPKVLMLREAYEDYVPSGKGEVEELPVLEDDFPSAADEPIYEQLPDYNLRVDEEPLFVPGENALSTSAANQEPEESYLSETQLSELEAFIARARAKKEKQGTAKPRPNAAGVGKVKPGESIEFEVDYGHRAKTAPPKKEKQDTPRRSFDFAFEAPPGGPASTSGRTPSPPPPPRRPAAPPKETAPVHAYCAACATQLPATARFCFQCGHPQEAAGSTATKSTSTGPEATAVQEEAPLEDVLILEELPRQEPATASSASAPPKPKIPPRKEEGSVSITDLKQDFRAALLERLTAYFGARSHRKYLQCLAEDEAFQRLRDGSLGSLHRWLQSGPDRVAAAHRQRDTFADLIEYFIVETAGDLSKGIFPQRLLRYQSTDWEKVDLFRLTMDYLDFERESETVYTDFVTMPSRALKNASQSFLKAGKDERVFLICDQSLISRAKNGFAVTDSGLYWKSVLQPAGATTFTTLTEVRMEQGHLVIDGQYFDAGGRLNLKMALLLDKLKRMKVG